MKKAGSEESIYALVGCVSLVADRPAFALPLFRDPDGDLCCQMVDEVTGRIGKFVPIEECPEPIRVADGLVCRIGDEMAYCLVSESGTASVGNLQNLRGSISDLLEMDAGSLGFRIQAASLLRLAATECVLRRSVVATLMGDTNNVADLAYRRSVARTILWDRLIKAAKNKAVIRKTLNARSRFDVAVERNGTVTINLDGLEQDDYPSLDLTKLAAMVEIDLGINIPSNDDSKTSENVRNVTISVESVRDYLDSRMGADYRISNYTYSWISKLLVQLGFSDVPQLEAAIGGYDGRNLSYIAMGTLQGQVARFELMLLAALGEKYIERHPWRSDNWSISNWRSSLEKFRTAGISVGTYDPLRHG